MIKCFWLEPTDRVRVGLRRYGGECKVHALGYHNAEIPVGEVIAKFSEPDEYGRRYLQAIDHPNEDPRWPTHCICGFEFPIDMRQVNQEQVYRRTDTGDEMTLRDAPAGAMWDAWWMGRTWFGADGICLIVRTPGGDWHVDARCSNCTLPDDDIHKCWVRHGDPRDPQAEKGGRVLHVDKDGVTCGAGAGSIIAGNYHGHLHNGHLVSC